jgi:hypothetical protein
MIEWSQFMMLVMLLAFLVGFVVKYYTRKP